MSLLLGLSPAVINPEEDSSTRHSDSLKTRIGVFVGFSLIFLLGILIFKGLTARRLYKPFGVKGLRFQTCSSENLIHFYQTTRCHTQKETYIHNESRVHV